MTYSNWYAGQPDNYGAGENCLMMYVNTGTWNDASCSLLFSVLCEFTYSC
jgi:hypothetical protein